MNNLYGSCASVLVAQDHSFAARAAARLAIQAAKHRGLLVRGLYVVDEALITARDGGPGGAARVGGPADLLLDHFREEGRSALHWLEVEGRAAEVPVEVDLQVGAVPETILAAVGNSCLVAMGKRGHVHAADPEHLGHHFRAVANRLAQPLLVGGDEQRVVRHLLLAYNGSWGARRALTHAAVFQDSLQARLTVLAVTGGEGETPDWAARMRDDVVAAGIGEHEFRVCQGKPSTEIQSAAAESGADMIIMGRFSHEPSSKWMFGSSVDTVLKSTHLPLLVA